MRRKGFTLVETIACCVILAVVTVGVVSVSKHINSLKAEARNDVMLSLHNLDCMERLRQMAYALPTGEELLSYYSSDVFGTNDFDTEVFIEMATLDDYRVYNVRIDSRVIGYKKHLVNTYIFTSIGGPKPITEDTFDTGITPDDVLGG